MLFTFCLIQPSLAYKPPCKKYRDFIWFLGVEILWKGTVSTLFWATGPKRCRNCAFPQNFHTRKSGKITVFFAVSVAYKKRVFAFEFFLQLSRLDSSHLQISYFIVTCNPKERLLGLVTRFEFFYSSSNYVTMFCFY